MGGRVQVCLRMDVEASEQFTEDLSAKIKGSWAGRRCFRQKLRKCSLFLTFFSVVLAWKMIFLRQSGVLFYEVDFQPRCASLLLRMKQFIFTYLVSLNRVLMSFLLIGDSMVLFTKSFSLSLPKECSKGVSIYEVYGTFSIILFYLRVTTQGVCGEAIFQGCQDSIFFFRFLRVCLRKAEMACWLCLLRLRSSWKSSSILLSCIISSIVNIILQGVFLSRHFGHYQGRNMPLYR